MHNASSDGPPIGAPWRDIRRFVLHELELLIRHREVIVANVSLVVVLGFLSSLLTGDSYRAHTTVLPPPAERESSLGHFTRRLPTALSVTGPITVMDEVLMVVRSRRVGEHVIERHDLRSVYGAESVEEAFWTLQDRLAARLDGSDVLHLELVDRSAKRAAAVLNTLVEELNAFYTNARRARGGLMVDLVQARLDSTLRRVAEIEVTLGVQQTESRTVYPAPAATEEIARIAARAMMLEVQLDLLARFTSGRTPLSVQRHAELASIREELARQPEIELEALRLSRDLAVQRQLRDLLTAQLAAAQALASREMPFVEVLDAAEPPAVRAWPGHARIVAASIVVGVATAVLIVHLLVFIERNRAPLRVLWKKPPPI